MHRDCMVQPDSAHAAGLWHCDDIYWIVHVQQCQERCSERGDKEEESGSGAGYDVAYDQGRSTPLVRHRYPITVE